MRPCNNCSAGCLSELPAHLQPYGMEIESADGVFIKEMRIPQAGTYVPQHSHEYDHTSLLTSGVVCVWKDGVFDQEYRAPAAIYIKAHVKHTFKSMMDKTVIYCIHNILRSGKIDIAEEHRLIGD